MAKQIGSFAKGFADAFLAAYKLSMTRELYEAREQYYRTRGLASKGSNEAALQGVMNQGRNDWGTGPGVSSGAGPSGHYKDAALDQYFTKAMTARGVDPTVARQVFSHEGAFNPTERTGDHGTSLGPFQFHFGGMTPGIPENNHPGMGDDFLKATGIDLRKPGELENPEVQRKMIDFAADRVAKNGWTDWNAAKNQGIAKYAGVGKPGTQVASADMPSKSATPEDAMTSSPDGGFKVPGSDPQPGRQGPAEVNTALTGGTYDPRTIDPSHTSYVPNAAGNLAPLYGPAPRQDDGQRPDLTARSDGPPEARNMPVPPVANAQPLNQPSSSQPSPNQPSPNAQPVSSTHAIPSAPTSSAPAGQHPGYTQVDAPNADPTGRNHPQMTAVDLSHLWGPNPPVVDRAPAPPSAPPSPQLPTHRQDDDMSGAVGAPNMDDATAGMQMGAAKGGPIARYARGGAIPATALAGGGPSIAAPNIYTANTINGPSSGFSPMAYPTTAIPSAPYTTAQIMNGSPTETVGGMYNANRAALSPDQQTYYDSQNSLRAQARSAQQGGDPALRGYLVGQANQMVVPKAALAPVAPTTPAPVAPPIVAPSSQTFTAPSLDISTIDPTTKTSTGIVGVPNQVTPKSYDPNVDGTTGSGSSGSANAGNNYSIDNKDKTQQILSAKGGAIPSRATGFAAGGAAAPGQSPAIAALLSPNYVGPTFNGGWMGTPYDKLAPNQQTWADTQKGIFAQGGTDAKANTSALGTNSWTTRPDHSMDDWNQLTVMPDAIWPTAPTAPTPINQPAPTAQNLVAPSLDVGNIDPTTKTSTGIVGTPNNITAKSYDPNVDGTTGGGFSSAGNSGGTNYSTDQKDNTQQILSAKGGPITPGVTRFEDGGGVNPSAMGAPPGMSGGSAIPPIYYNPATYAAAGAPVGKGITASSAPTFKAFAVPSLPMAQGGSVGYDDGGDVGGDIGSGSDSTLQAMDIADAQADNHTPGNAQAPPTSDKDPGWYINPQQDTAQAPGIPPGPAPQPQSQPQQMAMANPDAPPADPTQPQIKDSQGNPSRGLIGAISDGLHWLGDHLGLVGSAQAHPAIAQDANTQTSRQQFVGNNPGGSTYITHQNIAELNDMADPQHQLQGAYRNIAGLEAGYKWALSRGDDATAGRLAASILHYSVLTSQNLSAAAAKSLYAGNIPDAIDKINQASDAVPDGRLVHASLNSDGTVTVQGKDLNGQVLWQQHGAAATILERATSLGKSGKLQWDSLESQAAKYDSTYAQMAKNRQSNVTDAAKERNQQAVWQHQQDVLDTKQAAKDKAASDDAAAENVVLRGMTGQRLPGGGITPAVTPRVKPGLPSSPTTANIGPQPVAAEGTPPQADAQADTPQADTPQADTPQADTPQGATPQAATPQPDTAQADLPAPQDQSVSANQPPIRPDEVDGFANLKPPQQNQLWNTYRAEYKDWADQRNAGRTQDRMDQREAFTEKSAAARDVASAERAQKAEDSKVHLAAIAPMDERTLGSRFSSEANPDDPSAPTGKEPAKWLAASPSWTGAQNDRYFISANSVTRMSDALVNTQRFNAHTSTNQIADFVSGVASDQYRTIIDPKPVTDDYGTRYHVTYIRPDGSKSALLVPEDDMLNLQSVQGVMRAKNRQPRGSTGIPPGPRGPFDTPQLKLTPKKSGLGWIDNAPPPQPQPDNTGRGASSSW